jgi:hypothetical protein
MLVRGIQLLHLWLDASTEHTVVSHPKEPRKFQATLFAGDILGRVARCIASAKYAAGILARL